MPPLSLSDTNPFELVTTPSSGSVLRRTVGCAWNAAKCTGTTHPNTNKTDSEKTILRPFMTKVFDKLTKACVSFVIRRLGKGTSYCDAGRVCSKRSASAPSLDRGQGPGRDHGPRAGRGAAGLEGPVGRGAE